MLTAEDCHLLGLESKRRAQRPSAVSQLLRAISEDWDKGQVGWEFESDNQNSYRILVAADRTMRERAYRMAHGIYAESGYVPSSANGLIVSGFDAQPDTLTLLAEDDSGRVAGTVSLVFDSPAGLPCDELYRNELASLRAQGRRLVEVTRLAIGREQVHSKALLVHLFNFISVFAQHVKNGTDFLIEVNPRHAAFYQRLLLFSAVGAIRPCPRVNGAPAALLRLDLSTQAEEVRHVGGSHGQARGPHGKTLYAHFHAPATEHLIAGFLAAQHRPMTEDERCYFMLEPHGAPKQCLAIGAAR